MTKRLTSLLLFLLVLTWTSCMSPPDTPIGQVDQASSTEFENFDSQDLILSPHADKITLPVTTADTMALSAAWRFITPKSTAKDPVDVEPQIRSNDFKMQLFSLADLRHLMIATRTHQLRSRAHIDPHAWTLLASNLTTSEKSKLHDVGSRRTVQFVRIL